MQALGRRLSRPACTSFAAGDSNCNVVNVTLARTPGYLTKWALEPAGGAGTYRIRLQVLGSHGAIILLGP